MDMIKELDEMDFSDGGLEEDENDPDALVDEVIIEE